MRNHLCKFACATAAVLLVQTLAFAGPVQLRTGSSNAVDGYLEILPDEYGSWAANFATGGFGPNADRYKPVGTTLQVAAFTSGFYLFVGGTQRELLSDNVDFQATYPADATLSRSVTSPNSASDTNGNGVNDTSVSAFSVTGGATALGFGLTQHVFSAGGGVSAIEQNYVITNNGAEPISFLLVRSFDGDLLWNGDFSNDNVGTGMNGGAFGPYVYESEVGFPGRSVTLSGASAQDYFGGKHGIDPDAGGPGPAYNFGTDLQLWNAFGIPVGWADHIAGVGYNTNGDSGAAPAGSTAPQDGFIGLSFPVTLGVGQSTTIQLFHTYGSITPVPEPATLMLLALGATMLRRRK
jgi:hypothetical protein